MSKQTTLEEAVAAFPAAPRWQRLPIIRHIRAIWFTWLIARHYEFYETLGYLPINADYDYEIRNAIWRGEK